MFQLILSPRRGWEDIDADDFDARSLLTGGFIPLVVVTAALTLLSIVYHSEASWIGAVEQVIACLVKYIATYYLASFFFSLYIPTCTDGIMSLNKNHTFIIYSLSLLALLNLINNCLPMVPDMMYLLPFYVIFIMWRGLEYMEVKFNGVIKFIVLCVLTIVVVPFLLQFLFNFVIPD